MKKIYLLAGALVGSLGINAQVAPTYSNEAQKTDVFKSRPAYHGIEQFQNRAEGDTVWTNDFSTASDWDHVDGPSHTDGDWQIVSAVPASIVSQEPTYGFPTEMNSPTGDVNGGTFAFINSDAAGGSATQDAYFELQSDIDLSAYSNTALSISWYQIFRHFLDANYVGISTDGGTTWTDYLVNDFGVNVNSNDLGVLRNVLSLPTPAGGWTATTRIRLKYEGQWDWFWGVDDILIFETYAHDLSTNFFRPVAGNDPNQNIPLDYTYIPTTQSSFPGFSGQASFTNLGAMDQTAAALKMDVVGQTYSQVGTTQALAAQETDTFEVSTLFDIVSAGVGTYQFIGTPDLGSATDAVLSNDTIIKESYYGGNIFARDDESLSGAIGGLAGTLSGQALTIGNFMEAFDDVNIGMMKMYIVGATDNTPYIGQEVYGAIYTLNGDGTATLAATTEIYVLSDADMNSWISIKMDGNGVATIPAGTAFIATVNNSGGTEPVRFGMAQSVEQGTVLGIDPTSVAGDIYNLTDPEAIKVRLLESAVGVDEVEANFNLSVYPNPATDNVNIDFTLATQTDVTVNVTDISGKVVYTNAVGNLGAGEHTTVLSTSELTNGVYFCNFVAGESVITKKLVVKK
ncbi:Por secretion system C-terminal sorting domain-containing protein [Lishizhenia tianjinensis]|uniref:Por secretion system C-terminal sorting domain-containing protein n=1 Tax=Lishizhenia tianjinensis TaxID=477690 RepID=A0A1I7AP12_9FLAO|nr:T9SS type A sorting domain-containing protein [Lishizhenia tianjinensis]SFT76606.1 Por secretion system C-terminal sorting domain-containing protein [Lishizhenia tianjinensis]